MGIILKYMLGSVASFAVKVVIYLIVIFTMLYLFKDTQYVPGMEFGTWYENISGCNPDNGGTCFLDDKSICWSCKLFNGVYDSIYYIAYKLYDFFVEIGALFLFFAFAFWLLDKSFRNAVWEGELSQDPIEYWKNITTQLIKVLMAAALMFSLRSFDVVKYTAEPVFYLGTEISNQVIDSNLCEKFYVDTRRPKWVDRYITTELAAGTLDAKDIGSVYSSKIKNNMNCILSTLNVMYLSGISSGVNFMNYSHETNILDMTLGLCLMALFVYLMFLTPFYLIDSIITIGIFITFAPFIIAGYVFKRSENLGKEAIKMLKGTAVYLVVYSFVVSIIYLSFLSIADIYYPGPVDNFTYIFPDFIHSRSLDNETFNKIQADRDFAECYRKADSMEVKKDMYKSKRECFKIAEDKGIVESTSGASFLSGLLPLLLMGILVLNLFGKETFGEYTGIFSGTVPDLLGLGDASKKFIQSLYTKPFKGTVNKTSSWVKGKIAKK